MLKLVAAFLAGSFWTVAVIVGAVLIFLRRRRSSSSGGDPIRKKRPLRRSSSKRMTPKPRRQSPLDRPLAGWIRVESEYLAGSLESAIPIAVSRQLNSPTSDDDDKEGLDGRRPALPSSYYFAQLDSCKLRLYNDDNHSLERQPVRSISLAGASVDFAPEDLLNFEIFSKDFPLCIRSSRSLNASFYLFNCSSLEKEDWYIRLLVETRAIESRHIESVEYSRELVEMHRRRLPNDSLWVSALIERVYAIDSIHGACVSYLTSMFEQKIKRAARDSLMGRLRIGTVELTDLPKLSQFQVLDMSAADGLRCDFYLDFCGKFTVGVESDFVMDAIVTTVSVPINVTIEVGALSGRAQFWIKPKPSNRIWMGFHAPGPKYSLDVLPQVSAASMRLSLFTDMVRSQLESLIQETIVIPHMEDLGTSPDDLLDYPWRETGGDVSDDSPEVQRRRSKVIRKNPVTNSYTQISSTSISPMAKDPIILGMAQGLKDLPKRRANPSSPQEDPF